MASTYAVCDSDIVLESPSQDMDTLSSQWALPMSLILNTPSRSFFSHFISCFELVQPSILSTCMATIDVSSLVDHMLMQWSTDTHAYPNLANVV